MAETQPSKGADWRAGLPESATVALGALDEHKSIGTVVLDMREVAGFTDYMIVTTGRGDRHVQALVDAVSDRLRDSGHKLGHVEGRREGKWVLLDVHDLIVHVFTAETRAFYQLEKLWRDAPLYEWSTEEPVEDT